MEETKGRNMAQKGNFVVDLDKVLGRGAFGTVHDAADNDGRKLAAKRIDGKEEEKVEELGTFLKELVKLDHKNVVKVYDVTREGKTLWMFMEFCHLGDLVHFFQKKDVTVSPVSRPAADNEKFMLMLDIAKGVEYLHSKNVIHRNIKPNNTLVSHGDYSKPTAKLTDFDLSKFLEEPYSTSVMSSNVGTQAFKAPEFFLRNEKGQLKYHRSVDVYAMGLTFLAMIQENAYLFPRIETPNEPGEVSTPIGLLMWERQKYKIEPLQIVKEEDISRIDEYSSDLWRKVRGVIKNMTHVTPENRTVAAEVVREMKTIGRRRAYYSNSLTAMMMQQAMLLDPTGGDDLSSLLAMRRECVELAGLIAGSNPEDVEPFDEQF